MDTETKLFLGKILGEVYRMQKRAEVPVPVADDTLYGLLNGFEFVIDEMLADLGHVTHEQLSAMEEVLDRYYKDPVALANLKGFYDIEDELKQRGISRGKAITLIKYFRAGEHFTAVLDKFDTSNSPGEVRDPRPGECDG